MAFGTYTSQRARQKKDTLDRFLGQVENRLRQIVGEVPNSGAMGDRSEQIIEQARDLVHDQQALIDERTDTEVAA